MNQVTVSEALDILNPVAQHLHVLRKNSDLDKIVSLVEDDGVITIVTVRGDELVYDRKTPILFARDDI
jgi:hypothetical protein